MAVVRADVGASRYLIEAVRLNSLQFTLSRALGPSLGALLVGVWGTGVAFLSNAVTYLLLIVAIYAARPEQVIVRRVTDSFRSVLVEGARYAFGDATLRRIMRMTFLISALGQSTMNIAAAASDRLYSHSAEDNAWLVAAVGAGSAVASLGVLVFGSRARRSAITALGIGIYSVGLLLIPLTGRYAVGVVAFGLTGAAHMLVATSLNTFVQATVPDAMRGRVLSFYLLGVMLGMPAGAFALGALGDAVGLRAVLVADTVAFVVLTAVTFRGPAFARIDDETPVHAT